MLFELVAKNGIPTHNGEDWLTNASILLAALGRSHIPHQPQGKHKNSDPNIVLRGSRNHANPCCRFQMPGHYVSDCKQPGRSPHRPYERYGSSLLMTNWHRNCGVVRYEITVSNPNIERPDNSCVFCFSYSYCEKS